MEGCCVVEGRMRAELDYSMTGRPEVMTVAIGLPLDNDMKGSLLGMVQLAGQEGRNGTAGRIALMGLG